MAQVTQEQLARPLVAIGDFVSRLRQLPEPAFSEERAIEEFLRSTPVDPETLAPYLFWDRQHYTRNLIDKTPLYELIAICWEVGQASSIHNHRGQNCWMAVPIGRLQVQNYRVRFEDVDAGRCQLEPTDLIVMDPRNPMAVDRQEPVHSVFNPREFGQRAVSLHIYSRPFDSCVVYSVEQQTCGEIKLSYNSQYGVSTRQTF